MSGSGSPTDLGITLQAPGGIQTTSTGALLVCDQSVACGEFAPGSTTMTNLFATKNPGSFGVALDKSENRAWVENGGLTAKQLQRYNYPGPDNRADRVDYRTGRRLRRRCGQSGGAAGGSLLKAVTTAALGALLHA